MISTPAHYTNFAPERGPGSVVDRLLGSRILSLSETPTETLEIGPARGVARTAGYRS